MAQTTTTAGPRAHAALPASKGPTSGALATSRPLWVTPRNALLGLSLSGAFAAGLIAASTGAFMVETMDPAVQQSRDRIAALIEERSTAVTGPMVADATGASSKIQIKAGESLAAALNRAGISQTDSQALIQALGGAVDPRRLRIGQEITVQLAATDASASLKSFSLATDVDRTVTASRDDSGRFLVEENVIPLSQGVVRAQGTIDESLFASALKAGIPTKIVLEMIRLFSFDVDFQREIQPGDKFEVFFERQYDDAGKAKREGVIQYAALTLSGQRIELFRYTPNDTKEPDYFDRNGKSARKALLRTPIDGARLTSGYGIRRHPILGYTKMHKGVDFAAATGTPIMAAGSGTVDFIGNKGGYGKLVMIRHNSEYKTAYGHMSRFAAGIKQGQRVSQGQVIGYVGSTGMATGPHLHYEVHVNGSQVNPNGIRLPSGRKLEGPLLAAFTAERQVIEQNYAAAPPVSQVADAR